MWRYLILSLLAISFILSPSCNDAPKHTTETASLPPQRQDTSNHDPEDPPLAEPDQFYIKINAHAPLLADWGFQLESSDTLDNREAFNQHWWLKIFQRKPIRSVNTSAFPTAGDWSSIRSIRQVTFRKNWKFLVEEWQLDDEYAANRWLNIALSTQRLDDAKPPRTFWIDGDRMYIIMATAAKDWFDYGPDLVKAFSGKNNRLIHLFNEPINLSAYKQRKRGANSGMLRKEPYYFQPDTAGAYYRYFLFHQLRTRYSEQELYSGLEIKTYFYGDEPGQYETIREELIGVKANLVDPDLRNLDMVGKNRAFVAENFGLYPTPSDTNYVIEVHNGALLILHFNQGIVDWFNYLRTTIDLEKDPLPEELKYYQEQVPDQPIDY